LGKSHQEKNKVQQPGKTFFFVNKLTLFIIIIIIVIIIITIIMW